ncbi:hypothetical protein IU486_27150 [Streptomyces gardneri]|nr:MULTISPECIES: hypothetical protein [Nocardia]MBF6168400.1 hypothetical protein [Streptomyces gardneri]MBF6205895.1 hypothetical protein [Streptomyces gardneri]
MAWPRFRAGGGTDVGARRRGLPDGTAPEQNELGRRICLGKLAAMTSVR